MDSHVILITRVSPCTPYRIQAHIITHIMIQTAQCRSEPKNWENIVRQGAVILEVQSPSLFISISHNLVGRSHLSSCTKAAWKPATHLPLYLYLSRVIYLIIRPMWRIMAGVLDVFPDEVLHEILFNFAQQPKNVVFFLEHCVNNSLRNAGEDKTVQELITSYHAMIIHYPHSGIRKRQRTQLPSGQRAHCLDWLVLNTTCRRIRRLGKEIFFRTRCFAMTTMMPLKLQQRSFVPTLSKIDQQLALACIEDVAFVDENIHSPSGLVSLPRRLTMFPNLRSCLLVYGYRLGEGYNMLRAAVGLATRDVGGRRPGQEMALELTDLLHDIGLPAHIYVGLAFPPAIDQEWHKREIKRSSYPMLRHKARSLQIQAET